LPGKHQGWHTPPPFQTREERATGREFAYPAMAGTRTGPTIWPRGRHSGGYRETHASDTYRETWSAVHRHLKDEKAELIQIDTEHVQRHLIQGAGQELGGGVARYLVLAHECMALPRGLHIFISVQRDTHGPPKVVRGNGHYRG
jgi:hypothetical protein